MLRPQTSIIITFFFIACGPAPRPGADGSDTSAGSTGETSSTGAPTGTSGSTTTGELSTTTGELSTATGELSTTSGTTSGCKEPEKGFINYPDGGCAALVEVDGEFRCGPSECDVFAQDCFDCKKCVAWAEGGGAAWNATKCVPPTGDGHAGDPCTVENSPVSGEDDCAPGLMCWDVDAENHGTCVPLCTGHEEAPVCPAGLGCAAIHEGVLHVCLPPCDPLLQDCEGDDLCLAVSGTYLCIEDASGDTGAVNDPCEFANDCDKGMLCLKPSSTSACDQTVPGCCQPYCKLPGGNCPNPDQTCLPVYDPQPTGFEDVGYCTVPR